MNSFAKIKKYLFQKKFSNIILIFSTQKKNSSIYRDIAYLQKMTAKKGLEFELIALEFSVRIFSELGYNVTRRRNQNTGTQDGYDNLIDIVTSRYKHHTIYTECKDYSSSLSYTQAIEKIPHIVSTREKIDLLLFISPYEDFKNPNEPSKLEGFYNKIGDTCPIQFLSPEYYVEDYFRLYPDLFKQVYKKDPEEIFPQQRQELLEKFDKLIFSDRNLKKIVIEDIDKEIYVKLLQHTPHHIDRTFRKNPQREQYFWNNPDYTVDIKDLIARGERHIAVLGNPGSGKTTELKRIALSLWDERKDNDIIPFFKSLKNFSSTSTIQGILPDEFQHIPKLVIIFDGLDEVDDITGFSNKLRTFIDEQSNAKNIQFIISCRTSIYNKIVKDLDGFEKIYLNPIVDGQALGFLMDKYNVDFINKYRDFNFWRYRDLLDSPFYLELIGKNYLRNGTIEISKSKLIAQYIEHRLEEDESKKFRNSLYNDGLYREHSKRLALALETMQLTAIEDSKARALLGETDSLSKNPFIEQSIDKKWSFELKTIQEYFVAEMLSKMQFDEIIELIKLDATVNKIHPSWHNVVTLLLNIKFTQKETYEGLVDWLVTNDIEMIFQADIELVSEEIRSTTLQSYFQTHCIEKTLWIGNEAIVGKFGDTASNIEYLFTKALDKDLNLRARLSAVVLLEYMSLSTMEHSKRVETLLLQVNTEFEADTEDLLQIMERTIKLIPKTNEIQKTNLLKIAIDFVSKYDYREFVHAILPLIDADNFEDYQDLVFDLLKKALREKTWACKSKYGSITSTKQQIFDLFSKLKKPAALLKVLDFVTKRLKNAELREKYVESFFQHCANTLKTDDSVIRNGLADLLVDVITTDKIYHMEEHLLVSLAKECSIDEEIFIRLLEVENDKNTNIFFLEEIIKEEWFPHVLDSYSRRILTEDFLIKLRNRMQYDKLSSAIKFQNYIEGNSKFRFIDRIEDSNALEQRKFHQNSAQREFDTMFDLTLLKAHMENIFYHYNATELSYDDVDKFWDKYYHDFDLQKRVSEYAKRFLWEILKDQYKEGQKLSIKDLNKVLLESELDRLEDIYQALPKDDNIPIVIKEYQIEILKTWTFNNKITVENFLANPKDKVSEEESKTLTLFLNLLRYFKFSGFKEDFLLSLVDFIKYTHFDFSFIEELVDREKVTKKALAELKTATHPSIKLSLLSYLKSKDISFDIDQYGIEDEIKDKILNGQYDYARKVIKLFYMVNVPLLKEVSNLYLEKNEDQHLLPFILDNLTTLGEHNFIRNFITEHYELLVERKLLEEPDALRYLIKSNGELAFKKLKAIIIGTTANAGNAYYNLEYGNYSNSNSIDDLLDIAKHCLSLSNYDSIFNGWFKPLRMVSEALLNIGKNSNVEKCNRILTGIQAIEPFEDDKQNNRFYHESLINDIKNIVYKHKSEPFKLEQAMAFNRKFEHLFY